MSKTRADNNAVTIREVYELLQGMSEDRKRERDELLAFISQLREEANRVHLELAGRIEKHENEIYGKEETRGIKSRMSTVEEAIKSIADGLRWERYKQYGVTLVSSVVAAIIGAKAHQ